MVTRRIDLPAGEAVNLETAAALVIGTNYTCQSRGAGGPLYIAELTASNPTPEDIADAGYLIQYGEQITIREEAGATIWATAPNGGRLTIGEGV